MKKILIATVASVGLFAAGATFTSMNTAARPSAQIAVNEGHEQSEPVRVAGEPEHEGNSGKFAEGQHEEMNKQFAAGQHEEMNKQFAEGQHEEMIKQG